MNKNSKVIGNINMIIYKHFQIMTKKIGTLHEKGLRETQIFLDFF